MAISSSIVLYKNGDSYIIDLLLMLREKHSDFDHESMMLGVGFLQKFFINLMKFPSSLSLLRVFIMNGCCAFVFVSSV